MTRRPDPSPDDELLLDALAGELDAAAEAALQARLAAEPELAARRQRWERLLAAERDVFAPAAQTAAAEADAPRLAAWIRSTAAAEETARTRVRFAQTRQRGWARVLAWSVGLHVLVLGVLAFVMGGADEQRGEDLGTQVALEGERLWDEPVDAADVQLAYDFEKIRWDEVGEIRDRLALGEPESLQDELRPELESLTEDQPPAWGGLSHPVGVVVAMSRRTNADLKRRRLDLLGFNASGTLKAVDRGLRYLGRHQRKDGSFGSVDQTALTLLAFLGDGHTSRGRSARDKVVARGVAWLRQRAAGGMATVALCEDYMLSYGDLPPKAAQRRAEEIATLAAQARTRLAREGGDTWDVWALDAAARTGVVSASAAEKRAFQSWVESTAAMTEDGGNAMATLSAGTALMFTERGAEKPRFLAWSRTNAERLVAGLDPTGRARSQDGVDGEAIGETALILLALQVAYRTY